MASRRADGLGLYINPSRQNLQLNPLAPLRSLYTQSHSKVLTTCMWHGSPTSETAPGGAQLVGHVRAGLQRQGLPGSNPSGSRMTRVATPTFQAAWLLRASQVRTQPSSEPASTQLAAGPGQSGLPAVSAHKPASASARAAAGKWGGSRVQG